MLQALERRVGDETLADQAAELLLDVLRRGRMRLERRQFLLDGLPVGKHQPNETADFLRQQT